LQGHIAFARGQSGFIVFLAVIPEPHRERHCSKL
jgi:hypothetical protein